MSRHELEGKLTEIISKAVVGKGKKTFSKTYLLKTEDDPDRILGCWVANHTYSARLESDSVLIKGSCDINVWYSCQTNSKTDVIAETVYYTESIHFHPTTGRIGKQEEVKCIERGETRAIDVGVNEGRIEVEVETELWIEIIGETKLCVLALPCELLEDETDYFDKKEDEIDDDIDEDDDLFDDDKEEE